jgi:hypothetical protein
VIEEQIAPFAKAVELLRTIPGDTVLANQHGWAQT